MKYKKFKKIVKTLRDASDKNILLYQLGIDTIEFTPPYHEVIDALLKEILTEEQQDWFDWFCWENDFGRGALKATDKEGNPIVENIKGLYKEIFKK